MRLIFLLQYVICKIIDQIYCLNIDVDQERSLYADINKTSYNFVLSFK